MEWQFTDHYIDYFNQRHLKDLMKSEDFWYHSSNNVHLQVNALSEWIIGIYPFEFTNNESRFDFRRLPGECGLISSRTAAGNRAYNESRERYLKIWSSLLVNEYR